MLVIDWLVGLLYGLFYIVDNHWYPGIVCSLSNVADRRNILIGVPPAFFMIVGFTFMNISILRVIKKQKHEIKVLNVRPANQQPDKDETMTTSISRKQQIEKAKLIGLMLLFLFAFYVPYIMLVLLGTVVKLNKQSWYNILIIFSVLLLQGNNVANPIIYGWKDQQVKQYVKKFFKRDSATTCTSHK